MEDYQKQALLTAKELYPTASILELIEIAKTIEAQYYTDPNVPLSLIDFCQSTKIRHPIYGDKNFILYNFQKCYMANLEKNKQIITISGRQMGATNMLSKYALWKAISNPYTTVQVLSNSFNSATEIRDNIQYTIQLANSLRQKFLSTHKYNKSMISFPNGSEIKFGAITRNTTIDSDIIIIDNTAFISHAIFDDFWIKNRSLISTNRQIIMGGAAGITNGTFYNLYANPDKDWVTVEFPWNLHPERDQLWASDMISNMGQEIFDREYGCKFTTAK